MKSIFRAKSLDLPPRHLYFLQRYQKESGLNSRLPWVSPCFVILIMFIWSTAVGAAETSTTETHYNEFLDGLAMQLEIGRHQQLNTIKRSPESVLNDFTTDGCSGGLSAGWGYLIKETGRLHAVHGSLPPWEACCVEHDRVYHTAGSRLTKVTESFYERKNADIRLRACVLETGVERSPELHAAYQLSEQEIQLLYTTIADLMYYAVRLGGVPCSGLPWRWGYGWPECR